jgi:hypothetical protein
VKWLPSSLVFNIGFGALTDPNQASVGTQTLISQFELVAVLIILSVHYCGPSAYLVWPTIILYGHLLPFRTIMIISQPSHRHNSFSFIILKLKTTSISNFYQINENSGIKFKNI